MTFCQMSADFWGSLSMLGWNEPAAADCVSGLPGQTLLGLIFLIGIVGPHFGGS